MNETQCALLIESVEWTEPRNIISLAILGFIDILVIVGNCLVIAAVFCSHKLRSVTNFFIVSLAVADLLVGLAVLPFSATWEVFKVWIFGDLWCRIWLAVDVWMCTASILNLCAISLDRYVAVTRPIKYPSIMSTRRAKMLIAGLWVLSFVICFPPLVGWKNSETPTDDLIYYHGNHTLLSASSPSPTPCPWTCELTNDTGYVVYSALGSFYIPMFVMLFFYWRIYNAAVSTTRAINQGFRTTKGIAGKNKQNEDEIVTLRIHRGNKRTKPDITESSSAVNLDSIKTTQSSVNLNASASSSDRKTRTSSKRKEKIKISISYPSSDHIGSPTVSTTSSLQASFTSSCSKDPIAAFKGNHTSVESSVVKDEEQKLGGFSKNNSSRKSKKHIKVQIRKFKLEAKAAKTLGLVVGMFIISWLPFFSVYLVRAFYKDCISDLLFSILFWLGYCNSAINPFIYAAFSSAFRFAFKSVIYRCFCSKKYCEENKFHVLHRFVPFPFAPPLAATASLRQDLDNGR